MTLEQAKKQFPRIWTVYDHPRDYPDFFVARAWYGEIPSGELLISDSVADIRRMIEATGASVLLARDERDDPCIVECWI